MTGVLKENSILPSYRKCRWSATGGIGWYRKRFQFLHHLRARKHLLSLMEFTEIVKYGLMGTFWVNGLTAIPHSDNDLTPYLQYGTEENIIVVRVDNSQQPNSRWYSGSRYLQRCEINYYWCNFH